MKAIVQDKYGQPEAVLALQDIAKPVIKDGEVLVRVRAASIHVGDLLVVTGVPYIARPAYGKAKDRVPGTDIAGTVEAVGAGVIDLKAGDEVFGWCTGAFAEYASAPADHLVPKPANLTFEQAAAVGVSASTALQLLREQGQIKPGQQVLINGASGGIGTFAVQIAKTFGAEVTGVCSTRNADLVRSIGADHVIDYTKDDFTHNEQRYDVIFDLVGNRSLTESRRALTPAGTLVLSGGGVSNGGSLLGPIGLILKGQALSRFVRHRLLVLSATPSRESLVALSELAESGKLTPVIDRTYPLDEVPEAIRYLETDHARAKVTITLM